LTSSVFAAGDQIAKPVLLHLPGHQPLAIITQYPSGDAGCMEAGFISPAYASKDWAAGPWFSNMHCRNALNPVVQLFGWFGELLPVRSLLIFFWMEGHRQK